MWWRWTAPADGPVTFDTFGPGVVDTVLGVYTGDDVAATTTVAEDDDLDANQGYRQSRVTFRATAGTTYSILVDGHAGLPTGNLRLNWSQEVVVPTNLAAALAVVDPPRGTTFAYRLTLTRSGGDDLAEVPVTLTLPTCVTAVAPPDRLLRRRHGHLPARGGPERDQPRRGRGRRAAVGRPAPRDRPAGRRRRGAR